MEITRSLSSFTLLFQLCFLLIHQVLCGKISASLPGVLLTDYRFGLGDPYVIFYERNNYRGGVHFQILGRTCKNLPEARQNWASSVDVQRRCITVCDEVDCGGHCMRVYADSEKPNMKGIAKLSARNMNDKIKSVKFCYPMM